MIGLFETLHYVVGFKEFKDGFFGFIRTFHGNEVAGGRKSLKDRFRQYTPKTPGGRRQEGIGIGSVEKQGRTFYPG